MREKRDTALSKWLDLARWLSALAVLVRHIGDKYAGTIWALPAEDRSLPFYGFQFLSGFSHQAVMVFFVLSGFLIGTRHYDELASGQSGKIAGYLIRRFARLWAVVIPALLLAAALDSIGSQWLGGLESGFYPRHMILNREGIGTLACNAVFLQTLACRQFGTNLALWSLANEAIYYLLFPLVILGWQKRGSLSGALALVTVIGALLLASIIQTEGSSIGIYMAVWLSGVVAGRLGKKSPLGIGLSAGLFLIWLLGWRLSGLYNSFRIDSWQLIANDLCLAALLANLLWAMRSRHMAHAPPFPAFSRFMAGFSFSLYAIHVPLYMLLGALYNRLGLTVPFTGDGLQQLCLLLLSLLLILAISALFARLTERQTGRWQHALCFLATSAGLMGKQRSRETG
ncbi:acyltransferase family protein [Radicibacter daui]|uniref:acyltransferase family protein n=1 Tax=Radicibacter daui TaxID=3064829 RepID=UPI004046992A